MTFLELQNLCASWLDDLNFGYFTRTQVQVWLNNAQKEVQKRLIKAGQNYYLRKVQTTLVINQRDYVLPTDFKKENRLELVMSGTQPNESVSPLLPVTLNQQDLVNSVAGTPAFYFFKRNRITLIPAPQSALVMRLYYSYLVPDMTIDNDVPDCPESYHELIALLAVQDGFVKDGRSADLLNKKIAVFEKDMDSDANERNQDIVRSITETGFSSDGGAFF